MNKRLIVLAVAAAASVPAIAMADDSTVTLYGTLNVDFENVKADGCASGVAPAPCSAGGGAANISRRNRVQQNSSNIGFRGVEDLGGGLKAVFQIEQGVNLDTGAASSASTGTFATRNSKLGLAGGFGEIFLGNWDTPYKISTTAGPVDGFYGTGIANYVNVVSGNSTPTSTNAANRNAFDRRQNNVIHYITPNLSGFSGRVAYSANEQKTADGAVISQDPSLWSASATYAGGPVYVSLAYERHDEYSNSATEKAKDDGIKVSAAYTLMGTTTIGLIAERLKFKGNIATVGLPKTVGFGTSAPNEAKIDAFYLSLVHKMGPHAIRAAYGQDRGVKLTGGTGTSDNNTKAKMWALGYSFSFSKRTDLYALYSQIKNDDNSRNDFAIGGIGTSAGTTGIANGADPTGFGVGLRHTF